MYDRVVKLVIYVLSLIFALKTFSQTNDVIQFPVSQPLTSAHAEQLSYTAKLISFLNIHYQAEIKNKGEDFVWNFDWSNPYLGAGTTFFDNTYSVILWGGMVRATGSDFEVLSVILCHELGHILGGTPYQRFGENAPEDWSSAEGQADWFAATKCLPKVFQNFKDTDLINKSSGSTSVQNCRKTENPSLCQWIRSASQKFSDFLFEHYTKLDGTSARPSLIVDAPEVVEKTIVGSYPSPQCRLDTLKRGAICAASSFTNESCQRPACWYAEGSPY